MNGPTPKTSRHGTLTMKESSTNAKSGLKIEKPATSAYRIPTDGPEGKEADGTLEWNSTTMVIVEAYAQKGFGIGYTYSNVAHRFQAQGRS
jgi:hypothetical protein